MVGQTKSEMWQEDLAFANAYIFAPGGSALRNQRVLLPVHLSDLYEHVLCNGAVLNIPTFQGQHTWLSTSGELTSGIGLGFSLVLGNYTSNTIHD